MKATFDLAGDLSVEVCERRVDQIVTVTIFTGWDGGRTGDVEHCSRHVERELSLPKGTARAIASAIMGCAAGV